MQATYQKYNLQFKIPAGTSRGVMLEKETYFLILHNENQFGIGECGLFKGLSADDLPDYEQKLQWLCLNIHQADVIILNELKNYPSILFGWEQAVLSLKASHPMLLFRSLFTEGKKNILINGLIWMGKADFMQQQIIKKLQDGFNVLKLKVGALDFETECAIIANIRKTFNAQQLEIRLDANGAFSVENALTKLAKLSQYDIHSIEQPLKAGQWQAMANLCQHSPIPIALDEELIGINDVTLKNELLQTIQPQFIILKPSLHGGFSGSLQWIDLAKNLNIDWWNTSALESNIGLNAIAQFTASLNVLLPQGLGTGGLFTNNFDSPLQIVDATLHYNPTLNWNFNPLINKTI